VLRSQSFARDAISRRGQVAGDSPQRLCVSVCTQLVQHAHARSLPRMQPSCAVFHPPSGSGWRVTQHGAHSKQKIRLSGISARPPLATSGAPHSSFGTYYRLVGDRAALCSSQVRRVLPLGRKRGQPRPLTARIASSVILGSLEALVPLRDSSGSHRARCMGGNSQNHPGARCAPLGWDRCRNRLTIAPQPAHEHPPSRATVMCHVPPTQRL
jgi:hypothetical protein